MDHYLKFNSHYETVYHEQLLVIVITLLLLTTIVSQIIWWILLFEAGISNVTDDHVAPIESVVKVNAVLRVCQSVSNHNVAHLGVPDKRLPAEALQLRHIVSEGRPARASDSREETYRSTQPLLFLRRRLCCKVLETSRWRF